MPTVSYEAGPTRFERRIGQRVAVDLVEVTWVRPPTRPGARPRRTWPGRIVDVSVTGAAIEGPRRLPWSVGHTAVVRFMGSDSAVTIRWAAAADTPGVTTYGVEFATLHEALRREVHEACGEGRPTEDQWHRTP